MMHVYIDYGPYHDERGRRLPPYTRCWASCDLCKQAGEPIYGDTDFDKGMARAQAGLGFVFNTTGGNGTELCAACRTVRFEYEGGMDSHGRYHFSILWQDECLWDEQGRIYKLNVRTRGQCFFADPTSYVASYRQRGFTVVEIDKT